MTSTSVVNHQSIPTEPRSISHHRHSYKGIPFLEGFFHQVKRVFLRPAQLDFDYAFAIVADLITLNPNRVYKISQSRVEIKGHYSRDDPAYVILLLFISFMSSLAFHCALHPNYLQVFSPFVLFFLALKTLVYFALLSFFCATSTWWALNKYFRRPVNLRKVEWFYCFDIHCNAFLVSFLLFNVGQYVFLPFLIQGGLVPLLLGNSLLLFSVLNYIHVSILGFFQLPNLHDVLVLWYSAFIVVLLWFFACMFRVSLLKGGIFQIV